MKLFFHSCPDRSRARTCTISGSDQRLRTRAVRQACVSASAVSVALGILVPVLGVAAADPGSLGRQQRQQAAGWLQLRQDQKSFREDVEPLAPLEAESLDRLERQQRSKARALERRQQQSLGTDRNRRRGGEAQRPVSRPNEQEVRRQQDRQRLDMRIQRETLRPRRR